ncbi:hypothetical protein FOA52_014815 [Chlamydomonas sp. UWO 241]|nr:hypothetical protein FOA52_014815 [Chlamydomonas sp. UWO 241]
MAYGDEEDEYGREDDGEEPEARQVFKSQTVMLVDASEPMFEEFPFQHADTTNADGSQAPPFSYFAYAMRVVNTLMKSRVFADQDDEIALLFYNTGVAKNDSKFENVYTFLGLDRTDAARIKAVDELTDEAARTTMTAGAVGAYPQGLRYGLWGASMLLQNKSKANKTVMLLTRDHDPCGGNAIARTLTLNRAAELRNSKIQLQLMPLPAIGELFDLKTFWQELILCARDGGDEEDSQAEVVSEYGFLEEMSKQPSTAEYGEYIERCMSGLSVMNRRKQHKLRAIAKIRWRLLDGLAISVHLFNLVQKAEVPKSVNVHKVTNALLRPETRQVRSETGAMLTKQDIVTVFKRPKANEGFPEHVLMSRALVNAVKGTSDVGLTLLGFKARSLLRDHHGAGSSSFLRPSEEEVKGSVTAFKALLDAMVREGKVAICCFRSGANIAARLVALIPQLEAKDVVGVTIIPDGMHMIRLPFSDDIRAPERDPGIIGTQIFPANAEQIDAAAALIDKLTMKADENYKTPVFDVWSTSNPALQRAHLAIECKAMGEALPPLSESAHEWDNTQPDFVHMRKPEQTELIGMFKDAVYGLGSTIDGGKEKGKGVKRAADAGPDADLVQDYRNFDWSRLAAEEAGLMQLTIPQLKIYLKFHHLTLSGTKAVVAERIRDHLDSNVAA